MAVNEFAVGRQLSQIELMGHMFRRAGFGATCDELEVTVANGNNPLVLRGPSPRCRVPIPRSRSLAR
jgi:hypothetical protein